MSCLMQILILTIAVFVIITEGESVPFIIINSPSKDLENFKTFTSDESSNYRTLTLGDDTVYIGAKDRVFGRDPADITQERFPAVVWPVAKDDTCKSIPQSQGGQKCYNLIQMIQPLNKTHILICGTNALYPKNKFLIKSSKSDHYSLAPDNVIRSPLCSFDPEDSISSLVTGSSIFSTPRSDLKSKVSVVKTIPNDLLRCNENMQEDDTNIVASFSAMDAAATPEMSKVYFISDEKSDEPSAYGTYAATVTQVCDNDIGGQNILRNQWTSLLKARLVCRTDEESPLVFDLITHAVQGKDQLLYGTFTTRHETSRTNAVCSFRLSDIQNAFNEGQYWEEERKTSHSYQAVDAPNNSLRPGICAYPGMLKSDPDASTSKQFPESHLTFMREHNLVTRTVKPSYPSADGSTQTFHKPLLIKNGDKFTQIAVDQVTDLEGTAHDVIFVATQQGFIYKFLSIVKGRDLESVQLAKYKVSKSPIVSMKLSQPYGTLYVGTDNGVHQLSTSNCAAYNKTCDFCDPCRMCILSRDPNCAWDRSEMKCTSIKNKDSSTLLQDVSDGDAVTQCDLARSSSTSTNMKVDEGATENLGHIVKNLVIVRTWYKVTDNNVKEQIKENSKYRITMDGQLEISKFNAATDSGTYECEYSATSVIVAKAIYVVFSSSVTPVVTMPTIKSTPSKIPPGKTNSNTPSSTTLNGNTTDDPSLRSSTPSTTATNEPLAGASTTPIIIGVIGMMILILIGVLILFYVRRRSRLKNKTKKNAVERGETNDEIDGNAHRPDPENSTNNNNAHQRRLASTHEQRRLLNDEHDEVYQEDEYHPDNEPAMQRGAKSLDDLAETVPFIDGPERNESPGGVKRNLGLEQSSSLREEGGRKRVPPARTKSMPGSALYVVYAGKKLECSTLQRNKKGNWVIEVPNQSGMSEIEATEGEDDIIDIVHDSAAADNEASFHYTPSGKGSAQFSENTTPPHSDKRSESPPGNSMQKARKAFFDTGNKARGGGRTSPTLQFVTSTPNQMIPPLSKFESRKKPLKGQKSEASLRSFGQNSSEEPDSDSTVKGSSSTLKQEDTPTLKHESRLTGPFTPPKHHPHHHHLTQQGAISKVPTSVPTSDVETPSSPTTAKNALTVAITSKPDYFNHSSSSLGSSGSDGDEQLHGRDKNVSRKNRSSKAPDSPSKESHSSSSSASSSDYKSARSSVISEQNHEQR